VWLLTYLHSGPTCKKHETTTAIDTKYQKINI
jgi:hypothetical protein